MNTLTLLRFLSCFLALAFVAGCASTEVTKESMMSTEEIVKPDRFYVYPFASTPDDIPSWSLAAERYAHSYAPSTPESLEAGRKLGVLVAKELAENLRKMGLPAMEGNQQTHLRVNDGLIIGYFETIEEGSSVERVMIGFGSGEGELRMVVEGYQMTPSGPRYLGSGELQAGGGKTPGAVAPIAVFAATSNPIGLIVMGSAKVAGEVTGQNTIEGTASRAAKAIAEKIKVRFKKRGWVQ